MVPVIGRLGRLRGDPIGLLRPRRTSEGLVDSCCSGLIVSDRWRTAATPAPARRRLPTWSDHPGGWVGRSSPLQSTTARRFQSSPSLRIRPAAPADSARQQPAPGTAGLCPLRAMPQASRITFVSVFIIQTASGDDFDNAHRCWKSSPGGTPVPIFSLSRPSRTPSSLARQTGIQVGRTDRSA